MNNVIRPTEEIKVEASLVLAELAAMRVCGDVISLFGEGSRKRILRWLLDVFEAK